MYYINENIKDLYRIKNVEDRSNVTRLDMNENPLGLPVDFVENVKKKITPSFIATYPTKTHLTELLSSHNNVNVENITITAGSDEAMRLIFQCFGEPGKKLLTVNPTFEMYDVYSKMFGLQHETVEYNSEFTINSEDLFNKINEDTSIIILVNPNSPIGTTYSSEEIENIIVQAERYNSIVVIDEAYYYFYDKSAIDKIKKHKNVIVLRTFSKLLSIAGLRIGYAMADSKIIEYMDKAGSMFNVDTVSLLFASELIKNQQLINDLIAIEHEGHDWLAKQLKDLGYKIISGEGNYVLFYPHIQSSVLVQKIKHSGIWTRDYNKGVLKGWIRISTGEKSIMQQVLNEIVKYDKENINEDVPYESK